MITCLFLTIVTISLNVVKHIIEALAIKLSAVASRTAVTNNQANKDNDNSLTIYEILRELASDALCQIITRTLEQLWSNLTVD